MAGIRVAVSDATETATTRVAAVRPDRLTRRRRGGLGRELVTFGAIGIVSTTVYTLLYLALRLALDAFAANALALLVTAVGNTAANRRLTFGVRSPGTMLRHQLGGLLALAIALAITSASIGTLDLLAPHPPRLLEVAVLIAANATATLVRFVVLRTVITGHRPPAAQPSTVAPTPVAPIPEWSRS